MKHSEKDKLNQCLDILDSTDLGLSMVWLWTWSTVKDILSDEAWRPLVNEDEAWELLVEAIDSGNGFSLEQGAEQHYDEVMDWMIIRDMIGEFEDED